MSQTLDERLTGWERRLQVPDIPYLFVEIAMDDGTTEIVRKNQRAMSGLVQSDIDGC